MLIVVWFVAAMGLSANAWGATAMAAELSAARDAAAGRVCLVVAEDAAGVPLAYATGFLMGEGKFAITDLATLTQPGVKQATLRFKDGKTAVAKQFAMADPVSGVVAVQIEKPVEGASGLGLAAGAVTEAIPGIMVGWKWGQDLDLAPGQVAGGVSVPEVARAIKAPEVPKSEMTFLSFEGARPEVSSGSPFLDKDGQVVGVYVQLVNQTPVAARPVMALVVPAAAIRSALLASDRQMRPLADLPKPAWPMDIDPLPIAPVTAPDLAVTVRTLKARSRCSKCMGKGTLTVRKPTGTISQGGVTRTTFRDETEQCPTCKGEGVIPNEALYPLYSKMAEQAGWLAWTPDVPVRAKEAAQKNLLDVILAIGKVGPTYRSDLVRQARADLAKPMAGVPRGLVVFAQVRETLDGPDGAYVLLAPHQAKEVLAVRKDRLAAAAPIEIQGKVPSQDHWVTLAGVGYGPAAIGDSRPIVVLPLAWVRGPNLGDTPGKTPGAGRTPGTDNPPTTPKKGEPGFFGL